MQNHYLECYLECDLGCTPGASFLSPVFFFNGLWGRPAPESRRERRRGGRGGAPRDISAPQKHLGSPESSGLPRNIWAPQKAQGSPEEETEFIRKKFIRLNSSENLGLSDWIHPTEFIRKSLSDWIHPTGFIRKSLSENVFLEQFIRLNLSDWIHPKMVSDMLCDLCVFSRNIRWCCALYACFSGFRVKGLGLGFRVRV